MATFPATKRYWISFRHSDVGLTPSFTFYKRADTLANLAMPSIVELSNGSYYFDVTFSSATDPDIIFEIDGGSSIVTEEIRYKTDLISPKDLFIDQTISGLSTTLWQDTTAYGAGSKGARVDAIGVSGDNSAVNSLFGKLLLARELIRGDTAGTTDGNDVSQVFDRIGAPTGASLSADVAGQTATLNAVSTMLTRALGMMHENSVLDQTVFDGDNNLTAARFRIYSSKANAEAAGLTGLIATYTITASYTGGNLTNYTVVKEP